MKAMQIWLCPVQDRFAWGASLPCVSFQVDAKLASSSRLAPVIPEEFSFDRPGFVNLETLGIDNRTEITCACCGIVFQSIQS
jgi:hypothetical protein